MRFRRTPEISFAGTKKVARLRLGKVVHVRFVFPQEVIDHRVY